MAAGSVKKRSKDSYSLIVPNGRDPETGRYRQVWITIRRGIAVTGPR